MMLNMLDMFTDTPIFTQLPTVEVEVKEEDTMKDKYLTFLLEEQYFALPIQYVIDIIHVQPITPVPNCPNFIRGITNLRGKVIPIMDLRDRFEKTSRDYDERTCIVVVEKKGASVGLLVDSVDEVTVIPEENVSPPPAFHHSADVRYIKGVGMTDHGVRLILDCGMVLGDQSDSTEQAT